MSENNEKPASVRVDARPVAPTAAPATRALHKRATLLTVLTSPRAWIAFFRDKDAPKLPKFLALLALIYIVSPVDAVPEMLAGPFGLLDDLGLGTIAATWLASIAAKYDNKKDDAEAAAITAASKPAP
jgi:uncharacterized membrane protein YkvA (DUF1232 family)